RVIAAAIGDHAPTRRQHVSIPGGVLPESARHDERIAQRPHTERGRVHAARHPAAVAEDTEDRHPTAPGHEQNWRIDQAGRGADDPAGARSELDPVGGRLTPGPGRGLRIVSNGVHDRPEAGRSRSYSLKGIIFLRDDSLRGWSA